MVWWKEGQTCCLTCVQGLMNVLREKRLGGDPGESIKEPLLLDVLGRCTSTSFQAGLACQSRPEGQHSAL